MKTLHCEQALFCEKLINFWFATLSASFIFIGFVELFLINDKCQTCIIFQFRDACPVPGGNSSALDLHLFVIINLLSLYRCSDEHVCTSD